MRQKLDFGGDLCQVIPGNLVDELVATQLLQVLQPDSLQLSLQAADDMQKERERLALNWEQRMERSRFECHKAEKHYRAVDPENRLVARTLEQQWEQALRQEQQVEEEFKRFQQEHPTELTSEDRQRIQALASDLPALWHSPNTNPADRKQIVRHLVEKIVMTVQNKTEYLDVTIHWVGDFVSQHEVLRPVGSYKRLRDFKHLKERALQLADEDKTNRKIAEILNREGFRPPRNRTTFNRIAVQGLLRILGRRGDCSWGRGMKLQSGEWLVSGLAKELQIPTATVHSWIRRRWVHAEREKGRFKRWICWADAEELERLRRLHKQPRGNWLHKPFPAEVTTPKPRPGVNDRNKNEK